MSLEKRGMFGKPKYKGLSKMVKMSSVEEARISSQELLKHFNSLKQRKYRVVTKKATVLAANRANAQLKRKNLTRQKSDDFREIEMIFRDTVEQMEL